jgi:hypothetical protein
LTGIVSSKRKLTDDCITDFINKNPDIGIEKLTRLANCSNSDMRKRVNKFNNSSKKVNYAKKRYSKFTDEYLIELVDKNHCLSIPLCGKELMISIDIMKR